MHRKDKHCFPLNKRDRGTVLPFARDPDVQLDMGLDSVGMKVFPKYLELSTKTL